MNSFVNKILEIQEIAIVLNATNLNAGMLNLNFLKVSGIIPQDWELSRQPVANPRLVQLNFKNGVNMAAQGGSVTFSEPIANKALEEIKAPEVAIKYAEKLPNANYQVVSINPRTLVGLGNGEDAASNFIINSLISPGPWRNLGQAPVKANLNFLYQLEKCQLNLSVNEAKVQRKDQSQISSLLFSGSFNYGVAQGNELERVTQLADKVSNWQTDMKTFQEIVHQKFLGYQGSVFPDSM